MRKSACIQFFEKFLCEVSKGHGYREHENPAVQFSKDAQAGKYNKYTDESYNVLLRETKDISAFWLNQSSQTASDVLRVAFENIDIDKDSLHKMAEILSECYSLSVTPFVSEEMIQELETLEEDFDPEECSGSEECPQPAKPRKGLRQLLQEERKSAEAQNPATGNLRISVKTHLRTERSCQSSCNAFI